MMSVGEATGIGVEDLDEESPGTSTIDITIL